MAFLNNNKFKEIREAAKNGNEKAAMILQAIIKGNQEDLDRLVDNYYKVDEPVIDIPVQEEEEVEEVEEVEEAEELAVEDLTNTLDKELEGIIGGEEVKDITFKDFLSNKYNDGLRNTRGADYFKAYNPDSRMAYLDKKKNEYKGSFTPKLKDIDRQYRDFDSSISKYQVGVNDMLDDDNELEMLKATEVYNNITNDHDSMLGLSRGHDEEDYNAMIEKLHDLVGQYGKKNVQAALNTLKSDNDAYKTFRNGQINNEIERYGKSLEKLLK